MPPPSSRRKPKLGQHFLADPQVRARILQHLRLQREDNWLEIGPGHGEMTLELAPEAEQIVAVERDPLLARDLKWRLSEFSNIALIEADFLQLSPTTLARQLGIESWRVYGNLPYYITSPILRHLFAHLAVIRDIHVVVQREVAERLVSRPGSRAYGYLSVLTQFHSTPEILQHLPRRAFRPAPRVESTLVRLAPPGARATLGMRDSEAFLRFAQLGFQHKRKTLANNLRSQFPLKAVQEALAAAQLGARVRAEAVSLEKMAQLYHTLSHVASKRIT